MHSPTAAEVVALRTARAAMEDREGPDSPVERIVYALGAAGLLIYPGDLAALRVAVLREAIDALAGQPFEDGIGILRAMAGGQ